MKHQRFISLCLVLIFSPAYLPHGGAEAKEPNIYISGVCRTGGDRSAFYYRNNERVELGEGEVYSLQVSGGDVYAAGYFRDGVRGGACYWKNGSRTEITGLSKLHDIFIHNGTVYACALFDDPASGRKYPLYLRGLSRVVLDDRAVWPASIFVEREQERVYVLGSGTELVYGVKGYERKNMLYYYREGKRFKVTDDASPLPADGGSTRRIWVSGGDIYILGSRSRPGGRNTALLWVNGREHAVFEGTPGTLCVQGSDVYVCGVEKGKGVVYRNGRLLHELSTGVHARVFQDKYKRYHQSEAEPRVTDIRVSGRDVYVLGSYLVPVEGTLNEFNQVMVLWKNGEKRDMSGAGQNTHPTSLFVDPGDGQQ